MPQIAEPAPRPSGPFRLGAWTVHPERNLLASPEGDRRLEPKAMDALVLLISRAGAVVSKDDLIDGVWEGRIISEGTLTNTIAELRAALGDDARNPRFIETIPKRGYRLLCPMDEAATDQTHGEPATRRRRRWWIAAAAAIAVAAGALAVLVLTARPRTLDPKLVLVVPFANRTGDPSLDTTAALAQERIAGTLSSSGIASPIPAADASSSSNLDEVCRLARARGAGLAVMGALYLLEGEVEVQVRVVDAARAEVLYAVPGVSGPRGRAAESVDDAVERGLGALATHLHTHAHSSLLARPPAFEAYREFLAGSVLFGRDMAAAVTHLEKAVALDPEFTSAQLRLAMSLRAVGRGASGRAILDKLQARRAELTEFEWLWVDAFLASFEGRWADQLSCLDSIRRMTPDDWTLLYLVGNANLKLNRPRAAIEAFQSLHAHEVPDLVSRHPLFVWSFSLLSEAHHMAGDHAAELASARTGRTRFPADHDLMVAEAKVLAALGHAGALDELIAAAESTPMPLTPANVMVEAAATAQAHDRPDLALTLASRAVARLRGTGSPVEQLLLGEALVLCDELDTAQAVLSSLVASSSSSGYRALVARGWLGAVAARRGDLETADAMDRELATIDDLYLYGSPTFYRAAIAAWLGHRDEAIELLRAARAAGWSGFVLFHDAERVLFEPLEGMAEYEAMLHPGE